MSMKGTIHQKEEIRANGSHQPLDLKARVGSDKIIAFRRLKALQFEGRVDG